MSKTLLKICGVTNIPDAKRLAHMNVDFIGLNFIPSSSRVIELEKAIEVAAAIKDSSTKLVALFRDQPLELIKNISNDLKPDFIQLHGSEHHSYVDELRFPVIKAVQMGRYANEQEVADYMRSYKAAYYLLDRETQGKGPKVSFSLAHVLSRTFEDRVILAGGITADDISVILAQVQPCGIDISSGVRTDGMIDFAKVEAVLEQLRGGI